MIFEQGLNAVSRRANSIVTVGTFDGVHQGHRKIISDLVRRAQETGGHSTLVTFDPHPREVLFQQSLQKLTTIEERAEILSRMGLNRLVVIPFSEEFSRLSAEDFVLDFLIQKIGMQAIVVGHDHRFGKGREGDVEVLVSLARTHQFEVGVIQPVVLDQVVVSSRKIRSLLQQQGDVSLAATFLTRPYFLTGSVVHGDARGRDLGYPTANLNLKDPAKMIPANGIYAVEAQVLGTRRAAMMSIGTRPAIKQSKGLHLEVHIFDFNRIIYGEELTVHFIQRIRDERSFDSLDELKRAMQQDEVTTRNLLEQAQSHRVPPV